MNLEKIRAELLIKDPSLDLDVDLKFKELAIKYEEADSEFEEDGVTPKKANISIVFTYHAVRKGVNGKEEVIKRHSIPYTNQDLRPIKVNGDIQYEDDGITPKMIGEVDYWRDPIGDLYILPACFVTLTNIKAAYDAGILQLE